MLYYEYLLFYIYINLNFCARIHMKFADNTLWHEFCSRRFLKYICPETGFYRFYRLI